MKSLSNNTILVLYFHRKRLADKRARVKQIANEAAALDAIYEDNQRRITAACIKSDQNSKLTLEGFLSVFSTDNF